MQPTMKLRWRLAEKYDQCVAFGEQWRSGFSDEWGVITGRVLQQWWETEWPHDHELYKGEWRDIPIEEET